MGRCSYRFVSGALQALRDRCAHRTMPISNHQPFQLIYVSQPEAGVDDVAVSAIGAVSRDRNLASGISGALLFDGNRFCQLLEGLERDVRLLMARITKDTRHRNVSVIASSHFGLPRLTSCWQLGACSTQAMEALVIEPRARNEVALAMFMSALETATIR